MAIHITPEIMEAMYELLRRTKPFCAWKLPEPDDVSFVVYRERATFASHYVVNGQHVVRANHLNIKTLSTLTTILAHEMCHMRETIIGARNDVSHGKTFQRLADQVCRHHQFDRGAF